MNQQEIDTLIAQSQGSIVEFNKKQEELMKNLVEERDTASANMTHSKKGKVIGLLSRVTEEAEAGTNMAMGYMENVLTIISKQQDFINDITEKYKENPETINIIEVFAFLTDNTTVIEELIYNAMDAFQFQDIGKQKLMKVMYTLAKLNGYLNELLGDQVDRGEEFSSKIEKKTLEHDNDKDKDIVDSIVSNFKDKDHESIASSGSDTNQPMNNQDVDNIVVDPVVKKGIDDIIAEFQQNNKKE